MSLRAGVRVRVTKYGGRCVIGTANHLLRAHHRAGWVNSDLGGTWLLNSMASELGFETVNLKWWCKISRQREILCTHHASIHADE